MMSKTRLFFIFYLGVASISSTDPSPFEPRTRTSDSQGTNTRQKRNPCQLKCKMRSMFNVSERMTFQGNLQKVHRLCHETARGEVLSRRVSDILPGKSLLDTNDVFIFFERPKTCIRPNRQALRGLGTSLSIALCKQVVKVVLTLV